MPFLFFDLPVMGESADELEVADNAGGIVKCAAAALRALGQPVFGDISTGFAQGIGDIVGKVAAASPNRNVKQLQILCLGQMLIQIDMAGAAAVQISGKRLPVESQLVYHADPCILYRKEIAVVAVAGNEQLAGLVPFGILYAQSFGRHQLCIEHEFLRSCGFVGRIDGAKHGFHIGDILGAVRFNGNAERFSTFQQTIDADGQILLVQRNKACIIDGQQAGMLSFIQNFIEGDEVLVQLFDLTGHGFTDVLNRRIPDGVLHQPVDVNGHDALAASGYAAGAKGKGESVVLQFVAKAAVMRNHTGRQREVRFLLVLHLEAIDIFRLFAERIYLFHPKVHPVIDDTVYICHAALVLGVIPSETMQRIVPIPCFSAYNHRLIRAVAYINDGVETKRCAQAFQIIDQSLRCAVNAIVVPSVRCVHAVQNAAAEFMGLNQHFGVQAFRVTFLPLDVPEDEISLFITVQADRIGVMLYLVQRKLRINSDIPESSVHAFDAASVLLLIQREIHRHLTRTMFINAAISEIHANQKALIVGKTYILFGDSIQRHGIEKNVVVSAKLICSNISAESGEKMIVRHGDLLVIGGADIIHLLTRQANGARMYPTAIVIDAHIGLVSGILHFMKVTDGHVVDTGAALGQYPRVAGEAAACETVHAIGAIDEEAVSLGPHISHKVLPFGVHIIMAVIQKIDRFYRKGKEFAAALIIEPVHEPPLEPVDRIPLHGCAVREDEVCEHAIKVGMVKVCDVPEHGLVAARRCRLIEAVHHLFEAISDDLINGAAAGRSIHHILCMAVIVIPVFLTDEIIQIGLPFGRGYSTAKLAGNRKYEIHKRAVESRQIPGCAAGAADAGVAVEQKRIERYRNAVGFTNYTRFIVAVDLVLLQLAQVFFSQINAVHRADLLVHGQTIQRDGVFLEQLRFQRSDAGLLHVRIGIDGAAACGIVSRCVMSDKILVLLMRFILGDSHGLPSFLSAI